MKSFQAVILAAGQSSRFWPLNYQHKSLLKIIGRPLIWYTLSGLSGGGIKEAIIVQGVKRDIEKEFKDCKFLGLKIKYLVQKRPKGMGDALWQTRNLVQDKLFVLNAERIDGADHIKLLKQIKSPMGLLASKTQTPQLYGILKLKGGRALGIVEKPVPGKEPSRFKVVGAYLLPKDFFNYYQKVKKSTVHTQHMYDFEEVLNLYMKKNEVKVVKVKKEPISLKYPWDLLKMNKVLMDKHLKPKISKRAKIGKNVTIEGRVFIEDGVRIFENAVIKGPCYIGKNCVIGNNAMVRDYTNLEEGVMVGAHAEIARCIFQKNAHVHAGFFGDSIFGENCRIGAGTVTANVRLDREEIKAKVNEKKINTGLTSLGAIVGENTNIGINVSLMPGVLIGSNCNIGPGSLVRENIEDNTSFFTEFKSIIKKKK